MVGGQALKTTRVCSYTFFIYIFYFFSPSFCIFIENRYFAYTAAIDSCRIVTGAPEEADGKKREGAEGASEENSEK